MWVLRVDIYESKDYPIVRHEFRGITKDEASRYFAAHLDNDKFLKGCFENKKLGKIQCETRVEWYNET